MEFESLEQLANTNGIDLNGGYQANYVEDGEYTVNVRSVRYYHDKKDENKYYIILVFDKFDGFDVPSLRINYRGYADKSYALENYSEILAQNANNLPAQNAEGKLLTRKDIVNLMDARVRENIESVAHMLPENDEFRDLILLSRMDPIYVRIKTLYEMLIRDGEFMRIRINVRTKIAGDTTYHNVYVSNR